MAFKDQILYIDCTENDTECKNAKVQKCKVHPDWFTLPKPNSKLSISSDWEFLVQKIIYSTSQQDQQRRRLFQAEGAEKQHYLDISTKNLTLLLFQPRSLIVAHSEKRFETFFRAHETKRGDWSKNVSKRLSCSSLQESGNMIFLRRTKSCFCVLQSMVVNCQKFMVLMHFLLFINYQ